jgi:anti-sigma factor RsiW
MVKCDDFAQLLYRYFANELSPELREEVDRHLAGCASCSNSLRQYEETVRVARSLPSLKLPTSLLEQFKAALEKDLSPLKPDGD